MWNNSKTDFMSKSDKFKVVVHRPGKDSFKIAGFKAKDKAEAYAMKLSLRRKTWRITIENIIK